MNTLAILDGFRVSCTFVDRQRRSRVIRRQKSHTGSSGPRRSTAFTLIELLVVISIIALLISILLPVLSNARTVAKSMVCRSNMRQIGLAVSVYAHEAKERVPDSVSYPPDLGISDHAVFTDERALPGALREYMQMAVYSPAANPRTDTAFMCPLNPTYANWGISYNYSAKYARVGDPNITIVGPLGKRISQAVSGSETMILADRAGPHGSTSPFDGSPPPNEMRIHALFLDGHVQGWRTARPNGTLPFYADCDDEWWGWYDSQPIGAFPYGRGTAY